MVTRLESILEQRWAEHERLRRDGATYSAAIRLAELENCLTHQAVQKQTLRLWEAKLIEARLSPEDVCVARKGMVAGLDRLRRMLCVGSRFVYEELMLAIAIRVELELVRELLEKHGFVGPDVALADDDLLEIARSKQHRAIFSNAQAAARRNWGIPIESHWLSEKAADTKAG